MVYNFALPPLVLHTFYREDASALTQWARNIDTPSDQTTFFNILDTHDGIGLMGARGILPEEDIRFIVDTSIERGALVSYNMAPGCMEEPYEINSTWWSLINPESCKDGLELQVKRYLASRSIVMMIKGVPGIYIHGALGSVNDYRAFEASGVKRDINRGIIEAGDVRKSLEDPNSKLSLIFKLGIGHMRARREQRAFHPQGTQRVLALSASVFAVLRISPEGDRHILTITGITDRTVEVSVSLKDFGVKDTHWEDIADGRSFVAEGDVLRLTVEPYDVMWLKPSYQ
jgi:sucrose phosphorylase